MWSLGSLFLRMTPSHQPLSSPLRMTPSHQPLSSPFPPSGILVKNRFGTSEWIVFGAIFDALIPATAALLQMPSRAFSSYCGKPPLMLSGILAFLRRAIDGHAHSTPLYSRTQSPDDASHDPRLSPQPLVHAALTTPASRYSLSSMLLSRPLPLATASRPCCSSWTTVNWPIGQPSLPSTCCRRCPRRHPAPPLVNS